MPGTVTGLDTDWDDLPDTGRIGLAVSGGADSLALMLLAGARADRDRFIVYSVDHALRPEAAAEVAFVCAEAARLGLAARGLRWEGGKPETGLQAAARQARYRLMGRAMKQDGATCLVTAHHARDQAETILMRLAHGSGLEGLCGMARWSEVEGVTVFRPLLETDPELLAGIVAKAGLTPVADPGNEDPTYERIRWRRLLPVLAREGLTAQRLVMLAKRIGRTMEVVDREVEQVLALAQPSEGEAITLPLPGFLDLPTVVAERALFRVIAAVSGRSSPPLGALEGLVQRLKSGASVAETLGGTTIRRHPHGIVIAPEGPRRRGLSRPAGH